MKMEYITNHHKLIQRILLGIIVLLSLIVLVGFISHEFLEKSSIPISDFIDNSTYISHNQNYSNGLIDIENIDKDRIMLKLDETLKSKDVTWSYSIDNGITWSETTEKELTVEKSKVLDKQILVMIFDEESGEDIKLKLKIPPMKMPNVVIGYSTENETKDPVTATLICTDSNIKVINNNGSTSYTFMENGKFKFEYEDEEGNPGFLIAEVDWIVNNPVNLSINYDIPNITNSNVTATVMGLTDDIKITNNGGKNNYVFKENGDFTFEYKDSEGKQGTITALVSWIDKTPPKAKIVYDITDRTEEAVTATLTNNNENIIIVNNDGSENYIFKENGKFTFIFQDEAGNTSKITASVSWIDKTDAKPDTSSEDRDKLSEATNMTKNARSVKTTYSASNVKVNVPTYKVKEALSLKKEDVEINDNFKDVVGNKSTAFLLSLERTNNTISDMQADMKISLELDPQKTFQGIYKLNNDYDIEELYYKKTDKNNIELEVESLGNFILSYVKKDLNVADTNKTASDLEIIMLFSTSIALIVGGITAYKKLRQ